jgi:hypothetical protein
MEGSRPDPPSPSVDAGTWTDQGRLSRTATFLRGHDGLVPRGVFRFSSFEEADAWMATMMTAEHARRSRTTSSASAERSTPPARETC